MLAANRCSSWQGLAGCGAGAALELPLPGSYLERNENGTEAVAAFDVTVIVPRIVVGFTTLGAMSRHVAVPDANWPAERFVVAPAFVVQRTVPARIG